MVNPKVTEPDVVPMTVEQHDQAVAPLATMICDWLQTRAATDTAEGPEGPEGLNPQQRHHDGESANQPRPPSINIGESLG